jgi:hypothetical protein
MSIHRWLQNLGSTRARRGRNNRGQRSAPRAATHRPKLEVLDDRLTPSFSWAGDFPADDPRVANFSFVPANGPGVYTDFNGDGRQDLFSISWPGMGDTPVGSVFLDRGDGTLILEESWTLCGDIVQIGAGDYNGDGRPDLAIMTWNYPDSDTYDVQVLVNNGDFPGSPVVPASSFAIGGFPSPTAAGQARTFTVEALDSNGNVLAACNGSTVHFTSSDPQAILPTDYTFIGGDNGVHTFYATLKTEGTQSITVTDGTATATQAGITVTAPIVQSLAVRTSPSPMVAGQAGSFTISALDTLGNVMTSYVGTIHMSCTDARAVIPADYTFTPADNGTHTFSATLQTAGPQILYVNDADYGIGNGGSFITVNAAAASTMTVAGFPSTTTAGVAGSLTVTLKDPYGNIASGYRGTVHFTSSDAKAVLPANYTFTASDAGVHTFIATLKTAGTQSISVKDAASASVSGTEGGITVKAAAASKFLISAPGTINSGVAFSLTLTVQDAYGNVVTGYTGTIRFQSTDGTATLPNNVTFTAADQGVHAFTGLVLRKKGRQTITLTDTQNSSLTGSLIEKVL